MFKIQRDYVKGFIDPLSLMAVGFLIATLVVGVVAVKNTSVSRNIKNKAASTTYTSCKDVPDSECNSISGCNLKTNSSSTTSPCSESDCSSGTSGCSYSNVITKGGTCSCTEELSTAQTQAACKSSEFLGTCTWIPPTTTKVCTGNKTTTTSSRVCEGTIDTLSCQGAGRSCLDPYYCCAGLNCNSDNLCVPQDCDTTKTTCVSGTLKKNNSLCNGQITVRECPYGCNNTNTDCEPAPTSLPESSCLEPCSTDAECGYGNYCYIPSTGCAVCKPLGTLCTPGRKQCVGNIAQTCNTSGDRWLSTTCTNTQTCEAGVCKDNIVSMSDYDKCIASGNSPGECGNVITHIGESYSNQECVPGSTQCTGDLLKTCSTSGTWSSITCGGGCDGTKTPAVCKPDLKAIGETCSIGSECVSGNCYADINYGGGGGMGFAFPYCHNISYEQYVAESSKGVAAAAGAAVAVGAVVAAAPAIGTVATTLASSTIIQTGIAALTLAEGPLAIITCETQGYESEACLNAGMGFASSYLANPAAFTESMMGSAQDISIATKTTLNNLKGRLSTNFALYDIYNVDPLETYSQYLSSYGPIPNKLKTGPMPEDMLYYFQEDLMKNPTSSGISDALASLKNKGIKITVLNAQQMGELYGPNTGSVCITGTCGIFNQTKTAELVLSDLTGYQQIYGLNNTDETILMAAQKVGHEGGHALDYINSGITGNWESELRQVLFNQQFYANNGQLELAAQYQDLANMIRLRYRP